MAETDIAETEPENVIMRHVPAGAQYSGEGDEQNVRNATAERPRERDEIHVWDGGPLPEEQPSQSAHSQTARAANYMGNKREEATADALRTTDGYKAALKQHPDATWNATLRGASEGELAGEIAEGPPPTIVNPVRDGVILKPLGDHTRPWDLSDKEGLTIQESARAMREYRDAVDQAEQAIFANVDQQVEAAQQVVEQPEPPPEPVQPEQPQVDPLREERARLAREQAQLNELRRASVDELRAASQAQQWREHAYANYPELRDQNALNATFTRNPARYQELQNIDQRIRGLEAQAAQHRQARLIREGQIAQAQQAQTNAARSQFIASEDAKYQTWIAEAMPQYNSPAGRARLQEAATKVLRSTGLTDAQIRQQWDSGYLRPFGFQQVIAQAAAHLDAQERVKNIANKRAPVPPVQVPGVYRPAGAGDEDGIRSLEAQMKGASTQREYLALARRLTQAKRAAGQLEVR